MATENWIRASIVSSALAETSKGVAAALPDPGDPTKRKGWERLLDYFHKSAPGVWADNDITKFKGQIPDWCGIFALWAIKTGGVSWVGTWRRGHGIASVPGMIHSRTLGSPLKIQEMLRDDPNTRNKRSCNVFVNGVRIGNKEPLSTQLSRRSMRFPVTTWESLGTRGSDLKIQERMLWHPPRKRHG